MKLGVIGFGVRLRHMVNDCMRAANSDLRVVAAIDPDEASVRAHLPAEEAGSVRFFRTVAEMVEHCDVDAIAIGTRCNLHACYAIEVAATGLPVFLEKPIATNLADAIALEEAFSRSDSVAVVSFPLRVSPLCTRIQRTLKNGEIGIPGHVEAFNYVPYGEVYFNSWYRDYAVTGGLFLQKATHDFDYIAYCMGSPIVRVAAQRSTGKVFRDACKAAEVNEGAAYYYENIGTPESGMNEDSSSALLEFANGSHGVYTQVFYSKRAAAARGARFSGYRGTLEFDWYRNKAILFEHLEPFEKEIRVSSELNHHGGDDVLAKNFIEVVSSGAKSIATIEDGLRSVYTCLAAKQSAELGQFCDVRQVGTLQKREISRVS